MAKVPQQCHGAESTIEMVVGIQVPLEDVSLATALEDPLPKYDCPVMPAKLCAKYIHGQVTGVGRSISKPHCDYVLSHRGL